MISLFALAFGAAPVLDRVDLLSEHGATWLAWELPRAGAAPGMVAIRWIEQVSPVFAWGPARLSLSLQAQTIGVETGGWPWTASAGLVTRAGLPVGGLAGVAVRPAVRWPRTGAARSVRLGVSVEALSAATWLGPEWSTWTVLPGVGVGIGRDVRPRAPWMR